MLRRVNFYLEEIQVEFLANLRSLSFSEHIRRAIDEYIEKIKSSNIATSLSKKKEGEENGK